MDFLRPKYVNFFFNVSTEMKMSFIVKDAFVLQKFDIIVQFQFGPINPNVTQM